MEKYKKKVSGFISENQAKIKIWIFVAIVGAMIFKGIMQQPQIHSNREQIAKIQEKIEYEKVRQQEIDELKDKVDTDEYIEKIAGDKLGLVKNNAKIFVDISQEQQ